MSIFDSVDYITTELMGFKKARQLSIVLSDAVLTKEKDRLRVLDIIGIYCDRATKYNIVKYFKDHHHIKHDDNITIEELINITSDPIYWNEEYSTIIHFKYGDFQEQYYNKKLNKWE